MLNIALVVAAGAALGFAALSWSLHRNAGRRSAARVAALSGAIDGPSLWSGQGEAFNAFASEGAAPDEPGGASRRQRTAILATAIAIPIVLAALALSTAKGPVAPKATVARQPEALELVAMHHARAGAVLKVAGTVRVHGRNTAPVTAVVTAIDAQGKAVATGRGRLEDPSLDAAGDASFEVDVPAQRGVNRYRVRFETPLGTLTHVDRRHDGAALPSD